MKRISRRAILRGAAGAAIALPWLEAMSPRRARAATTPKRFIVMFSPTARFPRSGRRPGARPASRCRPS